MRQLTEAAQAAKLMRAELKKAFPSVKFSVRSSNYAGGDSVHVNWTNGPTRDAVTEITDKYQYGHFDGMIDLYEYSNNIEGLPQVKYVLEQRTISDDVYEAKKAEIADEFGIEDATDENQWWACFSRWSNEVVYRELGNKEL
jgi:hypothetical protein